MNPSSRSRLRIPRCACRSRGTSPAAHPWCHGTWARRTDTCSRGHFQAQGNRVKFDRTVRLEGDKVPEDTLKADSNLETLILPTRLRDRTEVHSVFMRCQPRFRAQSGFRQGLRVFAKSGLLGRTAQGSRPPAGPFILSQMICILPIRTNLLGLADFEQGAVAAIGR